MADKKTKFKIPVKNIHREKISIHSAQQEESTSISAEGKSKRKKGQYNKDKHNSLDHSSNLDNPENKIRIKTDVLPKHKKQKLSPAKLENEDNCKNEDHHSLDNIIDYKEEKKCVMSPSNNADNSSSNVVSPIIQNRKANDIKKQGSNKSTGLIIDNSQDNHSTKCSTMEISFDAHQIGNKLKLSTSCLLEQLFNHDEHCKQMHKENENKMDDKSYTKRENECRDVSKFEEKCNMIFTKKEQEINLQNENKNESEEIEELKTKPQSDDFEDTEFCKGVVSSTINEGLNTIIECFNPLVTDNNNLSVIPYTKSSELAIYKESNIDLSEQSTCFNQKEHNANLNESCESEVEQNSITNDEMNESIVEKHKIKYAMTEQKNTITATDTSLKTEESKVKQDTLPNSNNITESPDSDKDKLEFSAEYKTFLNKETICTKLFTIPHMNALEYDKQYKYNDDSNINVNDKTSFKFINENYNHLHFSSKENQSQNNTGDIHNSTNIDSAHISEDKYTINDLMNKNSEINQINNTNDKEQMEEKQKHLTDEDITNYANDSKKQILVSDLNIYSSTELQNIIAKENYFSSSHQIFNAKSSKLIKELQNISINIFKENIFDEKELITGSIVLNENIEKDKENPIPIGKFAHLNELFQYNKDTENVDRKNLSIHVTTNTSENSVGITEDNQYSDQTDSKTKIMNNPNNIKKDIGDIINAPFLTTAMDYITERKSEVILYKDVTNDAKENMNLEISIKSPQEITQKFSIEKKGEKELNEQDVKETDATKQEIKEKDATDFTETDDDLDMDDDFALTASQLSMLEANEKMEMHSSTKKNTSQQTDISDYVGLGNNYMTSEIIKELHFLRDEMATVKKLLQQYVGKKK